MQAVTVEQLHDAAGDGGRRVDDRDAAARDDTFEDGKQERIVRAAEHDLVGPVLQHLRDGGTDGSLGLGRSFEVVFDQFDEAPAWRRDKVYAVAVPGRRAAEELAVEAPFGSQYPHHPAAGRQAGGFHGRLHAHDRHGGVFFAQEVDGGGRSGIAGHDDQLAPLRHKEGDRFVGKAPHLLAGARPVGAVLTVTQVDERLSGERTPHLAPDGQPAQPRIENTDGCII